MDTQPTRAASAAVIEEGVIEMITKYGGLDKGEIAVHFDLVASLRSVGQDGHERIRRLHWAPRGSDPHLSYGVLHAQAVQVLNGLT